MRRKAEPVPGTARRRARKGAVDGGDADRRRRLAPALPAPWRRSLLDRAARRARRHSRRRRLRDPATVDPRERQGVQVDAGSREGRCRRAAAWLSSSPEADRTESRPVVATGGDIIPAGQRNATFTSLAGTMRRAGSSEQAILEALKVTNQNRSEQPLDERELEQIARSVARYRPEPANGGIAWGQLSTVEMRSIVFVDKPLLQAAAFHLFVGRKGVGKGTLLAEIIARVTRGELGERCNVVWVGSEDSAAIDLKPRVVAAGGDPARISIVTGGWIQLPRDIDEISRKLRDRRGRAARDRPARRTTLSANNPTARQTSGMRSPR